MNSKWFLPYLQPYQPDFEWKNAWETANVRNSELVSDPALKIAGFDLPRKAWVRLNRIRTGHGNCLHFLYLWNMANSTNCDCGDADQTMAHIVNDCPIRKFIGGIEALNRLDDGAIDWLMNLDLNI